MLSDLRRIADLVHADFVIFPLRATTHFWSTNLLSAYLELVALQAASRRTYCAMTIFMSVSASASNGALLLQLANSVRVWTDVLLWHCLVSEGLPEWIYLAIPRNRIDFGYVDFLQTPAGLQLEQWLDRR